jgi:hypothetical protein
MKRSAVFISLVSVAMLHCSSVGFGVNLTGGGVIGNPSAPTLSFSDTTVKTIGLRFRPN